MTMKRSTILPAAILIILVIAAYFVLQRPGEQSRSDAEANYLVEYDSAAISRFEVTSSKGHVVLEKTGGTWMITDPIRYPAAAFMVTRAIESGRTIEIKSVVSTNPEKQNLFQVDSTGLLVRFYEGPVEKAAIRFGKTTTSFTETYVRAEGSDEVHIAVGTFGTVFDRKAPDWRDKTIFRSPRENLAEVRFAYGDTTFSVTEHDTVWMVDQEMIGEPTSFIASLSAFDTQGFVDTTITHLPPLTAVITVGDRTIRFHFDDPTDTYLVQSSASEQWFSIPISKAKQLLLRKADFLAMKRK